MKKTKLKRVWSFFIFNHLSFYLWKLMHSFKVYCYMKLGKLFMGGGGWMEKLDDVCIICDHSDKKGFHLCHYFICLDCHNDIVQTSTDDAKYQFYVNRLKKLIENKIYS
ncbi:sigma factor G inhibitor Gin [Thermolongibacillus altinsuensis]